jgi:hypothetical protein
MRGPEAMSDRMRSLLIGFESQIERGFLKNAKRKELRFQPVEAGFPETVAQGFLVAAKGIDVGSQKGAVVGRTVPEAREGFDIYSDLLSD